MKSTLGKGSEFLVEFPVEDVPETTETIDVPEAEVTFKKRILVADDNRVNRMVISKILSRMGCEIKFATNGVEAVELESSWSPDLILMDVRMPEMDGMDATRAIRAKERELSLPKRPIIGLSANAMTEHRQAGLASGMCGYLAKPIKKSELVAVFMDHWPEENQTSTEGTKQCA